MTLEEDAKCRRLPSVLNMDADVVYIRLEDCIVHDPLDAGVARSVGGSSRREHGHLDM